MSERRSSLTLLLSVALHALLLLLAWRLRPAPLAPHTEVIELEVRHVARPTPPEAAPPAPGLPVRRAPPAPHQRPAAKAPARGELRLPAASTPAPAPQPAGPAPADAPPKLSADRPVRALDDAGGFAVPGSFASRYGFGSGEGPNGGRTTRATDPGESRAVALAREKAEVEAFVQGSMRDTLAMDRVEKGLVDDYFVDMKHAFEEAMPAPPPFEVARNVGKAMVNNYVAGAARYGATGNPYAQDAKDNAAALALGNEKLLEERDRSGVAALDRFQDFMNGKFANSIVAIVEVRQDPKGKLLDARLVTSSGDAGFDAYAMAGVPRALETLPPAPPTGGGIREDGIHSLWAFMGKVVYAQPMQGAGDAMYLVLGGQFEETTGDVYVYKLDQPKYVLRARLLSVY